MEDLQQAIQAQNAHELDLLRNPNVTGVAVGFKEIEGQATNTIAVRVYVKEKVDETALPESERIPSELEGVPTDVIKKGPDRLAVAEVEPVEPLAEPGKERPVPGGVQIQRVGWLSGSAWLGTSGCFVKRNRLDGKVDPDTYLLTCAHVLYPELPPGVRMADDCVYQPASFLGLNLIGYARDYVFHDGGTVDAGLVWIQGVDVINYDWELGWYMAPGEAALNEIVEKHGRTTGQTQGKVVGLNYSAKLPDGYLFRDQLHIKSESSGHFAEPGDSGAMVIKVDRQDYVQPLGMLFAIANDGDYGVANRVSNVFAALDVHLDPLGP
jgi:hypothetical protein